MKHSRYHGKALGLWVALSILSACTVLKPIPDKSKFFLLTPLTQSEAGSGAVQDSTGQLILGLGPVHFPDYLERNEVVTRIANNQVRVSETDHWAEPLKNNFTWVLSQNLSILLGGPQIVKFPWFSSTTLDYQITVEVQRFETDSQGAAMLTAQWSIKDPTTQKILDHGEANLTAPSGSGEEEAAGALSQTLSNFSRQLATAIKQVNAQRHH